MKILSRPSATFAMLTAAHRRSQQQALQRAVSVAVVSFAAMLIPPASIAAPFVPTSDLVVLERLPDRIGDGQRSGASTRVARTVLSRDPKNLDLAVRVAQLYVARARSESDPRLLGQAQAALAPWWSLPEPAVPVLLLRATIRQSNHEFSDARRDLEQAVRREPANAQAWLTLATVQQVTGDLTAAQASCRRLDGLTSALVTSTCEAAVDGLRGRAQQGYDAIAKALATPDSARAPVAVRSWAVTLQAELAERLSRRALAEQHYRESLAVDPNDSYTIAAYSDFLIDSGRPAEVLKLIAADTAVDVLLLRRAIAAAQVGAPDAAATAAALGQRFAASRARGDRVHLREEARFALLLQRAPEQALALARDNWAVQKEPLDARVALEAAAAARNPAAVTDVLAWIERHQLQGDALVQLTSRLKRPT